MVLEFIEILFFNTVVKNCKAVEINKNCLDKLNLTCLMEHITSMKEL